MISSSLDLQIAARRPAASSNEGLRIIFHVVVQSILRVQVLLKLEMRVLDDAEEIAKRVLDRSNENVSSDILDIRDPCGSDGQQMCEGLPDIVHTPIRNQGVSRGHLPRTRIEPQFKSTDIEADVKRLVKVGLDAERFCVPGFGFGEIPDAIDDGSQTEEHTLSFAGDWSASPKRE
jgi:hypothetical protein